MSTSSETADQVVRMTLNGAEVAAKITGAGAKQLAVLLYAVLRDQKKTKGKMRLTNMLRSGKELKVFAVKQADLKRFCVEAKKYGVLYCVLKDKDATDGLTDVMVRAEDAAKINRIFERFKLATVDMAAVRSEIEKIKVKAPEKKAPAEKEAVRPNPTPARTEKATPSGLTSERSDRTAADSFEAARPSVKRALAGIKASRKSATAPELNIPGKALSPGKER